MLMSYATVKAVWPGEKAEDIEDLRNSHGMASVLWMALRKKYLPPKICSWFSEFSEVEALFNLEPNKFFPAHLAVLYMTADYALVMKKDYAKAASNIRSFLADCENELKGLANHWPRIAELFESNPGCPAIGFCISSVNDDPFQGDYDEDMDEYGEPPWDKFWDIYADLEAHTQCKNNGG